MEGPAIRTGLSDESKRSDTTALRARADLATCDNLLSITVVPICEWLLLCFQPTPSSPVPLPSFAEKACGADHQVSNQAPGNDVTTTARSARLARNTAVHSFEADSLGGGAAKDASLSTLFEGGSRDRVSLEGKTLKGDSRKDGCVERDSLEYSVDDDSLEDDSPKPPRSSVRDAMGSGSYAGTDAGTFCRSHNTEGIGDWV